MKRIVVFKAILVLLLITAPIAVSAQQRHHEKFWISGRVTGNTKAQVITLRLVSLSGGGYTDETSTNKYNWYAFSDNGQGPPSNYRLIVFAGNTIIKNVSLTNIKSGGRVADIHIP